MANGVARAPDGTVFASNNRGAHIDRIDRDGTVHRRWATVLSANGLAVDPAGRYLYAAQSFTAAAIKRVEIANPVYAPSGYAVTPRTCTWRVPTSITNT
jgi:DNA-binding beta-propeller fold protein YncE